MMGCPWGDCCYYVGRGRLSGGMGQLETRGWSGGRVRAQEPTDEGGVTLLDLTAV